MYVAPRMRMGTWSMACVLRQRIEYNYYSQIDLKIEACITKAQASLQCRTTYMYVNELLKFRNSVVNTFRASPFMNNAFGLKHSFLTTHFFALRYFYIHISIINKHLILLILRFGRVSKSNHCTH